MSKTKSKTSNCVKTIQEVSEKSYSFIQICKKHGISENEILNLLKVGIIRTFTVSKG